MGLDDIAREAESEASQSGRKYRRYPRHEEEDKLNEWAEDLEKRFPGGVRIDFIEVSPEMTESHGLAYGRGEEGQYIRLSEEALDKWPEWYMRLVLLHEMVHLWFNQNDTVDNVSDGDPLFHWVCGRVGADLNGLDPTVDEYNVMLDFFQH